MAPRWPISQNICLNLPYCIAKSRRSFTITYGPLPFGSNSTQKFIIRSLPPRFPTIIQSPCIKRHVNRSHTALRVLCPNEFAKHTLNISDSPVRPIPNNARALGLPWHVHAPYSTQNNTVGVLGAKSLPAGLRKHSPPIPKKEYQRTKTEQVEPIPSLINQT